jgi:hypothetical protein
MRCHRVIDTACTIFAFENRSYLGEFEAEFKKAWARESGAQGVLFDKKKPDGQKSHDTVPLNYHQKNMENDIFIEDLWNKHVS